MKTWLPVSFAVLLVACCNPENSTPGETPEQPRSVDPSMPEAYLGKSLEEASRIADEMNIPWRVVEIDGTPRATTMDHRPDRLNFTVAGDKIIRVTKG
ncbi:hypothetical protein [Luteolibacter marinus]|uniref:hypothetical protein n=1 Tax=Luteolibacter marinus TaxID=2776705 RepID=UPI001865B490|nr:hypothetical protein [Luteolibacter marinus]